LSPFATRSQDTRGRQIQIPESQTRTEFQRDRDRIIHCKAFRRLKHKTQVFLAPEGDHYRTRLTHTLEVSQIARSISRALRLNEDLTEAISLGHDLGHTPYGHAGERALNEFTHFEHNEQSLRVVDFLEYNGKGMNLTFEVRDGIVRHTVDPKAATLEGQIVKIADRMAYINHDADDAIRAGVISQSELPQMVIKVLGSTSRERINTMISSAYGESFGKNQVKLSSEVDLAMNELRNFMFDKVYMMPTAKREEERAFNMLSKMYEYFKENTDIIKIEVSR
jgi:dGTPase